MGSIVCVEASAEQGSWVAGILEQRGHTVTRVTGEGEAAPRPYVAVVIGRDAIHGVRPVMFTVP